MASDYLPDKDTLLAAWAANFSALITATPGAYGLMASDATTIATAYNLFNTALTLALNPATKTKSSVADKNAKKYAMVVTLRQYAQVIKRNIGISNDAKIALGLTINDSGRSPVPAPTTAPVLNVAGSGVSLCQNVAFRDNTTPDRRAKPAGVTGMILMVAVGTTPPASPEDAQLEAVVTRQNYLVNFDPADINKTAYYYGRWVTSAGLVGPWSTLATVAIS